MKDNGFEQLPVDVEFNPWDVPRDKDGVVPSDEVSCVGVEFPKDITKA